MKLEYTVLIVDDSIEDKTLYRYLLKRDPEFTYHLIEFDCGEDALHWCRYRTPDVILLDYMLPDWDGLTVLHKLRQQIEDDRPLPVIVLTGEGDERIAVQAIKNGAQDYLVKGKLTSDLLCRTIHNVVEQVRLLEQVRQQQAQLQRLNAALEIKVQERTTELQAANDRLQQELLKQQLTQKILEEQAKLLDLAHDGILTLDTKGMITFWNQGAERLYGWTKDEAMGKVANVLLQTQFSQPFAEIEATLTEQGFWEGELLHLHRNGASIQVFSRWVVRRNGIGKPIGVLAINNDITDRKIAEAQLQQSEERLKLALEASGEGLWDWNIETGNVYRSSQYLKILGYAIGELPGELEAWEEKIHPEDRDELQKQLNAHLQNQTVRFVYDYRIRTRSGDWKWVSDYGKVVARDANGNPLRMIGTYKDISDRKQAEEILKINEARWNFALAGNGDGVWDWNLQTNTVFFSRRWKEMLGFAETEIGDSISEWKQRIHPDDQISVDAELEKHFHKKVSQYVSEYRILCKNGTYKWVLNRGQVIRRTEDGQPLRMIGTHTDITKRKQAEEALRHSEATKRAIIAAIPDLLIRMRIDGTYVDFLANNQFNLIDPKKLRQNANIYNTLPNNLAQQRIHYSQRALQTGENQAYEQQVLSEGRLRYEEVRIVPVEDDEVLVMIRDITDRKIAELELQQAKEAAEAANQAKSIFLANMSHELRTPLNVILGFTQILRRNFSLSSEHQEPIKIIHRSGEHLLNLINDILDLSKIEAGRATSNESSFDLFALLKAVKDMLNHRATTKSLEFHLFIHPDVPQYITTDAEKLRQILLNLLSNAIKFTEQGSVWLRVLCASDTPLAKSNRMLEDIDKTTDKTTLLFEVEDTGAGIAASETEIIFNAFAQSRVGKTTPGGTGLGLTISRHFIELMGGSISVQSVLGQGSLFRVYLPVQIAQSADVLIVELTRQLIGLAPSQPSYRILAVDDQPENRMLLVQLMSELGMEVREAANGEEAVLLWQQWQPHLIWMDIQMPTMDGYRATQQIRALEAQATSPGKTVCNVTQNTSNDLTCNNFDNSKFTSHNTVIIALTAHAKSDRALTFTAGCNDLVTKPFSENLLYDKMAKYLGLHFLYAEHRSVSEPDLLPITQATSDMLTLQNLEAMPLEWLTALYQAAQLCDEDDVKLLLQQIPETYAALLKQLSRLVYDYQFEQIKQLLQAVSTLSKINI